DFVLIGNQVCAQFDIAPDSDAGRKVGMSYLAWWNQLRQDFDTDNDGRVTLEEFVAAYKDGRGDPERYFAEQLGRTVKVVVDMVDTDHDGFISETEYLTLMKVATDRESAQAGFQALDTDGDGRISVAEFQVGVHQLMLSSDPTAAGTGMLGKR
ncbi:MAG: EF-hand domain-containing protein, partial [Stackebrandtia sp.]